MKLMYWMRLIKWHLTPDIKECRCAGGDCQKCNGSGWIHNANGPRPQPLNGRLFCQHVFDACNLHRFSDEIVAGMCWKCNKVFTADCGLNLPGRLGCTPHIECPTCKGIGKVHAPKSDLPTLGREQP